jgi:hypothetical protein
MSAATNREPTGRELTGRESIGARVGQVAGWLAAVYALELEFEAERFVLDLSHERACQLLPSGCRSGLVILEQDGEIEIGLHLAPEDREHEGTVIEETSHLVCVAWHATHDLQVSSLILELQAEIDRFAFARLREDGTARRALAHFEGFRFADGLSAVDRVRYELAHERAHAYCRKLERRFPKRADTPQLVSELRRFYRASPDAKLRAAA